MENQITHFLNSAFYIFCVIAGLALAIAITYWLRRIALNLVSPVRRVEAVVIRKDHRQHDEGDALDLAEDIILDIPHSYHTDIEGVFQTASCSITFQFDGRAQEFGVTNEMYGTVFEGDKGLLVYKGEKLLHFIKGIASNSGQF